MVEEHGIAKLFTSWWPIIRENETGKAQRQDMHPSMPPVKNF
jgi:hypothetical protein